MRLRGYLLKFWASYPQLGTQLLSIKEIRRSIQSLLARCGRRKGKANVKGQEQVKFFAELLKDSTHLSLLLIRWHWKTRRMLGFLMLGITSIYRHTRRKWITNLLLSFVYYKFAKILEFLSNISACLAFVGRHGRSFLTLITGLDFTLFVTETFYFWYRLRSRNEWLTDEVRYYSFFVYCNKIMLM